MKKEINPVGKVAENEKIELIVQNLKEVWDNDSKISTKEKKIKATHYMLASTDELIKEAESLEVEGQDKKATVLNALDTIYDYVAKGLVPFLMKPFSKVIKNFFLNVVISYAIDWFVEKYNVNEWGEPNVKESENVITIENPDVEIQSSNKPKDFCSLFPFEVKEVVTLQSAKQQSGWGISAFELPKAWEFSEGEGVTIAVIDTGCDLDHPDLKNNLLPGRNFINARKQPQDDNGHGTHVAGIIAAINNTIGMVGVAPKAKIIPIKVLDKDGNGSMSNVAKAINWAVDRNVDIISMSLGSPRPLRNVRIAIKEAAKKGIPVFCAAGNAGRTKEVYYPAAYPETIAIGSIDKDYKRSDFSNTGKNLDFMAPGGDVFSTVPDDWYAIMSGTSMAAPFAVGVSALLLSYSKNNNNKYSLKNVDDYRRILRKYCTPISDPKFAGDHFFEGYGIIDPRKIKQWAEKNML